MPKTETCESLIRLMWNYIHNNGKLLTSKQHQQLKQCIEKNEIHNIENNKYNNIYPHIGEKKFNKQIAEKEEFINTSYPIRTKKDYKNIINISKKICNNTEFELAPHQMFIRNFMSFQTPYNSLLLFHGLGSGKTCSSITVCEEMRNYYKQLGIKKKIIIVAQPNVQTNYKLQLFDKSKLKKINGLWNIKSCTGNKFIKEINPMNMKGLSKDKVIYQINKLIKQHYEFLGHQQFSNKIGKLIGKVNLDKDTDNVKKQKKIKAIQIEFSNRLLVIDEVHNVRNVDGMSTKAFKNTSQNYLDLVKYANNMKLLLLTGTPMFNDHTEIIWLLNLMNLNDNRVEINVNEIFDKNGIFVKKHGKNTGEELLKQKLYGYISFIQGEDPFNFPLKLYPSVANIGTIINENSLQRKLIDKEDTFKYPVFQLNGQPIKETIQYLDLYTNNSSQYQKKAYFGLIEWMKEKYPSFNPRKENQGLSYTLLGSPLQLLNFTYPNETFNSNKNFNKFEVLYGDKGLKETMNYKKWNSFSYKPKILEKYGRIFSIKESLDKYSPKIASIIKIIQKSEGIVMIYSQYIGSGCVPIALALEEAGYNNYTVNNLFKSKNKVENKGKYMMITGDTKLSPKEITKTALLRCNSKENKDGNEIKVIIISKAGSEGIDFKNIRQIHILEPWYNLNRTGQIEGRGVRNGSHCNLPYEKRNVLVFLHSTILGNSYESVDFYVYRHAEKKALTIGKISRIIKENAIDCLLNQKGHNSQYKSNIGNISKNITLSYKNDNIKYPLGHRDYTQICDFMSCDYKCKPSNKISKNIDTSTYNQTFLTMNIDKIIKKIKELFKFKFVYDKNILFNLIRGNRNYSNNQIYQSLDIIINDKTELIEDMFNRFGNLINIGNLYLFQPSNVDIKTLSQYKRNTPFMSYKPSKIEITLPTTISQNIEIAYINEIKKKYDDLILPHIVSNENQNQYDWNDNFNSAYNHLSEKPYNISKDKLKKYGLFHLLDVLTFEQHKNILNELIKYDDGFFKNSIKEYYSKHTFEDKFIALCDYNKKLGVWFLEENDDGLWKNFSTDSNLDMIEKIKKKWKLNWKLNINKDIIGFMNKKNKQRKDIVFRTKPCKKDTNKRVQKGKTCERGNKNEIKKKIYDLYSKMNEKYSMKTLEIINGKIPSSNILCIILELLLRHFDDIRFNHQTTNLNKNKTDRMKKRWFFSPLFSEIWGIEFLPEINKSILQKKLII
jgi:hypothetical protein